jgi:hypothetical protein
MDTEEINFLSILFLKSQIPTILRTFFGFLKFKFWNLSETFLNFLKINQNLLVFFSKKFIFAQTKSTTDVLDIRISILFK